MKKEKFEMQVTDRFNFQGGRTVFVGKILGHPNPISSLVCNLRAGDKIIGRIVLEGELLREERNKKSGLRSVSTLDTIPELLSGELSLVGC